MKSYKEFKQDYQIDERYDKDLDADGNGKLTSKDFKLLRKKKKKTDCMEATDKPSSSCITTSKGTYKTKNDPFYPEFDKHEQGKMSDAKKKKYAELGLKAEEYELEEELEELELAELSKATLGSYIKKATFSPGAKGLASAQALQASVRTKAVHDISSPDDEERSNKASDTHKKRTIGINRALDKLTNEELELEEALEELELAELSNATLGSYINKAKSSDNVAGDNQRSAQNSINRAMQNPSHDSNITPAMHVKRYNDSVKTQAKRQAGISKASSQYVEDYTLELEEALEELELAEAKKYLFPDKTEAEWRPNTTYKTLQNKSPNFKPKKTMGGHLEVGTAGTRNGKANILLHNNGKYFAAGGSSTGVTKNTTFHDSPEEAAQSYHNK